MPLLEYSAESGIGRLVRALRGSALASTPAQPAMTAHLATVLQTMALDGRGVAWLLRSLICGQLAAGRQLAAGGDAWALEVEIRLVRPLSPLPRAAEGFWRLVAGG